MSSSLVKGKRPKTVTFFTDAELRERLERAAKENERSLGAEVRVALRHYLEREQHDRGGQAA